MLANVLARVTLLYTYWFLVPKIKSYNCRNHANKSLASCLSSGAVNSEQGESGVFVMSYFLQTDIVNSAVGE